ncbi:hypothetical protein PV10_07639 [Exophiala mesophila]|uniref:Major facilitator superfamily (MFS) profile domain-containing protein n=1 Tax=Exophiala mesophila TaxID=212818 RepID=A0A0D1WMS7_EXOME|nr:uncharacterized protein PV10_07639 [Exophiala mesophila]KIV90325.1 hypothetical protein PV10_07639 [Exophiala mesophila]
MASSHFEDMAEVGADKVHVHARTLVVVAAMNSLVIAQMFSVLGSGILARAIVGLLGEPTLAVWPSTILTIGAAALNPTLSQGADYWGRRWILVVTTGSGLVGAIMISRAQNIATVFAGFSFMSVMFGGQAASFAVVSEILPRKYRAIGQASLNVSQGVAGMAGVLFCGALLQNGGSEGYRIYFYVVAGLFAVATASIAFFYDPPPRELQKSLTHLDKLKSLDLVGMGTFTAGAILFSVGLVWANSPYPWTNARILGTFIIGSLLLLAFLGYEWLVKKDGIAHHGLFKDKNYIVALTTAFQEGLAVFTLNYFLTMEGIALFGLGVFQASTRYAMVYVYAIILSFASAWYMTRFKALKGPMLVSQVLLLIMFILMATVTPGTPAAVLWGYPLLGGLALGAVTTAIFVTAQLSITGELIAVGTALVAAARALGGMIGLVVNNAIFNAAAKSNIPTKIAEAVLPMGFDPSHLETLITGLMAENVEVVAAIPGITPEIIGAAVGGLRSGYSIALRNVWIAAACFTVPGVIIACFLRNPIEAFNAHIDAPFEEELVKLQDEVEGRVEHGNPGTPTEKGVNVDISR